VRILVTGASGLLGGKIIQNATDRGHEVFSAFKEHPATMGKPVRLDQTQAEQVSEIISNIKPQAIINTAAISDVDFCEENPEAAFRVNSESVSYLATSARETNSFLLQISTDYVFDGEKGAYSELDPPHPTNTYGTSKHQGEQAATLAGEESWSIARPSVIFGMGRPLRPNAATYVHDKLSKHETVRMVRDQYCSPTFNRNLAAMLIEVAERRIPGILHTAGATRLNRYDLALRIAEVFGFDRRLVLEATAEDIGWKAKRPKDSSLLVARATALLLQKPQSIDDSLIEFCRDQKIQENHAETVTHPV
jgi:dTDP-4-dehydrorhamnose reductase